MKKFISILSVKLKGREIKVRINVCVIDNESECARLLERCLKGWGYMNQCEIMIHIFSSCEEMIERKEDFQYHIFFLDIMMKQMSGIEFAGYLRERHYEGEIVFLTSFKEYAIDGYHVHALDYILKPVRPEDINRCMDYLLHRFTEEYYKYSYRQKRVVIPYRDIIYFISRGHSIDIVTATEEYRQPKSFQALKEERLPMQFLQCNRGIIINMDHIVQLQKQEVILTNEMILPVSATYAKELQEAYFRYV